MSFTVVLFFLFENKYCLERFLLLLFYRILHFTGLNFLEPTYVSPLQGYSLVVWVCGRVFCVCLLVNVNVHSLFVSQTSWSIYPKLYNNIPFSQTMVLSQTGVMNNQVVNGQAEDKAEGQGRIT